MLAITHEIFEQEIRGLGLPAALLTQSVKERALAVAVAKVSSQVDTDRRAAVAAIEAREGMPIRQLMMRQFMKHRPVAAHRVAAPIHAADAGRTRDSHDGGAPRRRDQGHLS